MVSVLFVCLGNICRSPAAEGIFQLMVQKHGPANQILIDSAGTSDYHVGELPDSRMRSHASTRGYTLNSRARQLVKEDLEKFDYIIAMDDSNIAHIHALDQNNKFKSKIFKMTDFATKIEANFVPDPYNGGNSGFERVLDILEDSCEGLLNKITSSM